MTTKLFTIATGNEVRQKALVKAPSIITWRVLRQGLLVFGGIGLWMLTMTPCSGIILNAGAAANNSIADVTPGFIETMTSTLYTDNSSSNPQQMTSCPWILPSLANAGFAGSNGWNFTFDGGAAAAKTLSDLSIGTYKALVKNDVGWTDPNGTNWVPRYTNSEAGGAFLQLNFNPTAGDPFVGKTVHWIQALQVTAPAIGQTNSVYLDNGGATTPYYDLVSAGGPTWFFDNPSRQEMEYEGNPVADWQGQVFLALDNGAGGGFTHNVTIYGGEWWGFQLTMNDIVPEPSGFSILALGAGTLLFFTRRQSRPSRAGAG
ncbi:MAG: hypothetical protein C5B50_14250 [Verrucomicrobia bacterium]|nr:MAG: hypothetical protein C5B50_14250 [Verrucomicrobiota bacterium]